MIIADYFKEPVERQRNVREAIRNVLMMLDKDEQVIYEPFDQIELDKIREELIVIFSASQEVPPELINSGGDKLITIFKELDQNHAIERSHSVHYFDFDNIMQLKIVLAGWLTKDDISDSSTL